MKYVIAAAGTGGHVYPALSVADALVARGVPRRDILFLGGNRFAAEAVPEAGYGFVGFELTHLRRSLSAENLRIPIVLRRAASRMADEIRSFGGTVVLGMSGYVTVPAAMAARRVGVRFVLQEQNAIPGLAARYASRRAERVYLGLPGRSERLPRSRLIGNPVRRSLADFERRRLRREAWSRYGIEGARPVVGVMGGSQGARALNEAVRWLVDSGAVGSIVHLTGTERVGEVHRLAEGVSLPWECVAYEPDMEYFYAAVDLVVGRAGAMTVSELAATGTPSVLVPLPRVGQQGNAAAMAEAGGAVIVPEGSLGNLPRRVAEVISDERRLAAMAKAAQVLHRPGAADVIAAHLADGCT